MSTLSDHKEISAQAEILPAQIERLDSRLKQIEKIAGTVEVVAEKGFEAVSKYFESKTEQEKKEAEAADAQHKREIELQDKKHKRATIILGVVSLLVFILVISSLYLSQFELVKYILGSSLAVAGGAGLSNLFKGSVK
ncbi:hypothetical protein [Uliginosibacterium aquaticum]|uniref:DUF2335 domain-containing protein n=1 Tax=Uliginosibacterium aquaticum TaxID=2731212 RepID=A0ABX2IKN5_9RHOO|nr:hypothetical protein [Uliginosibacterium aquaticum]NSL56872.1 hypothetical protein [Uliginosibacterium aquaticum]